MPATPMATPTDPSRQARPWLSLTIAATVRPVSSRTRAAKRRADASASSGRRTAICPSPGGTLLRSMPALAHTQPARCSTISTPSWRRISSLLSRRISSTSRGSLRAVGAISMACCDGSTSASRTRRASAREMTFWAMTKMSPSWGGSSRRSTTRAATSSPGWTSGSPTTGISRTSDGMRDSASLEGGQIVGGVNVESQGVAMDDGYAQAATLGFEPVAAGAGPAKAERDGIRRTEQEGVGAAVLRRSNGHLRVRLYERSQIPGSGERKIREDDEQAIGLGPDGPGSSEIEGAVQAALALLERGRSALAGDRQRALVGAQDGHLAD